MDRELLAAAQRGDEAAFVDLIPDFDGNVARAQEIVDTIHFAAGN